MSGALAARLSLGASASAFTPVTDTYTDGSAGTGTQTIRTNATFLRITAKGSGAGGASASEGSFPSRGIGGGGAAVVVWEGAVASGDWGGSLTYSTDFTPGAGGALWSLGGDGKTITVTGTINGTSVNISAGGGSRLGGGGTASGGNVSNLTGNTSSGSTGGNAGDGGTSYGKGGDGRDEFTEGDEGLPGHLTFEWS